MAEFEFYLYSEEDLYFSYKGSKYFAYKRAKCIINAEDLMGTPISIAQAAEFFQDPLPEEYHVDILRY